MADVADLFDRHAIEEAEKLGVEGWLTELANWDAQLAAGHHFAAAGLYLTDMRHLANLADPSQWTPLDDPNDDILDFGYNVIEAFIEERVPGWMD